MAVVRPHQGPNAGLQLRNKKRLEQLTPENARISMTPEQQQRANDVMVAMQAQRDQALNANVNLLAENAALQREISGLRQTIDHLKTLVPAPEPEVSQETEEPTQD